MFRKKKENEFLNLFKNVEEESSKKNKSEMENMTFIEIVKAFVKSFKYQTPQYKIIWIIRLLLWFLILLIALYEAFLRIKKIF